MDCIGMMTGQEATKYTMSYDFDVRWDDEEMDIFLSLAG